MNLGLPIIGQRVKLTVNIAIIGATIKRVSKSSPGKARNMSTRYFRIAASHELIMIEFKQGAAFFKQRPASSSYLRRSKACSARRCMSAAAFSGVFSPISTA